MEASSFMMEKITRFINFVEKKNIDFQFWTFEKYFVEIFFSPTRTRWNFVGERNLKNPSIMDNL